MGIMQQGMSTLAEENQSLQQSLVFGWISSGEEQELVQAQNIWHMYSVHDGWIQTKSRIICVHDLEPRNQQGT